MPRPRPAPKKPSSLVPRLLIITPLVALVVCVFLQADSSGAHDARKRADLEAAVAPVRSAFGDSGTTVEVTGPATVTITLPHREAMTVGERDAMELARTARDRIGRGITVRVKSPAGQNLAVANP